jgi:transcriptional regulator with XRE-family HTH domain
MDVNSSHSTGRKRTPEAAAFAAQLRAERAVAGVSQDELARRTGISKSTILRLESGERVMDTAQLGAICRALGIAIGTFAVRAETRMLEDRAAAPPDAAAGRS